MSASKKITDFAPPTRSVDLGQGKTVEVMPLSLYHISLGEQAFGDQKLFFSALRGADGATAQIKAIWLMIENKKDFNDDPNTFAKFMNVEAGKAIADAAGGQVAASMPPPKEGQAAGKSKAKAKKTKPIGESSSPSSAATTP